MNRHMKDAIGAAAFIALFGAFLAMARQFPSEVAVYPTLICGLGVLLSAGLLARSLRAYGRTKNEAEEVESIDKRQVLKTLFTVAVSVIYVMLTNVIGYFVTTFLFVVGFSYYLDPHQKKWIYPVVGVILNVVLYLAFDLFLNVNLPKGILF